MTKLRPGPAVRREMACRGALRILSLIAVLSPIAVFWVAGCSGRLSERTQNDVRQTIDLTEGVTHVKIEVVDGNITVKPAEGDQIVIRGTCILASDTPEQHALLIAAKYEFESSIEGGLATVRGPRMPETVDPMLSRVAVRAEVFVPQGLAVDLRAEQRGHLAVWDRQAEVRLENQFGDLNLQRVDGHGTLRSENGKVFVSAHRGSLDIELKAGEQVIYLDELREPGLRLENGQGRIQCLLPVGTAVQLDALTDSGKVTNGLDIPTERYGRTGGRMLGGVRGPQVRMRTGKGNLSLGYQD